MIFSKTVQYAIICGLFIFVLLLTSSFDLAFTISISSYLLFFQKKYTVLFIISILAFLTDILLRNFDITFRFISDLFLDSYILFLTAILLYLKSRKDFNKIFEGLKISEKEIFSKSMLLRLGISLSLTFLLFPIMGGYLAVLSGYIFYSYLTRQFNGKIAIVLALGSLGTTALFLVIKKNAVAEVLANYIYLFIIVGIVQEVINLVRHGESDTGKMLEGTKYEEVRKSSFTFPGIGLPGLNIRFILVVVSLFILSLLTYFLFPELLNFYSSLKKPKVNFKIPSVNLFLTPTPPIVASLTFTPSPTPIPILKVSSSSAKLKIFVLNGTEITGLAATTSAKLKKAGFQNIEIGNAQTSDYKNWEASLKKNDEDLAGVLKNVLELETLTVKEATSTAKFDIEIIVGEKK